MLVLVLWSFAMRTMFDLVLWSFVVSLAPLALGLGWKVFCGVGRFIDFGSPQSLEDEAEHRWWPGF